MEPVQLAAILAAAVLLASMVSVEIGISVALVELALGVALGNAFDLDPNASWLAFIASFASVVLQSSELASRGRRRWLGGTALVSGTYQHRRSW